jgi:hypothetical protein
LTPHPPTPSLGFRSTNKTTDFVWRSNRSIVGWFV